MNHRLDVIDLHVQYGSERVLRGVELSLPAGELVGLVGPNGSGKSTLLRALAGMQTARSGRVLIDGIDLQEAPEAAKARLGFAVEPERLPPLLDGLQCLQLIAELRGEAESIGASLELAERLGFNPWLRRPVHSHSLGTRQKLAVLLALVGRPSLIVLDEVLNGLDPLSVFELKRELRARADAGATVLLATHGLEVAERLLDRAVLLLEGRIAADWGRSDLAEFRRDPDGGLEHAVAERLRANRRASG